MRIEAAPRKDSLEYLQGVHYGISNSTAQSLCSFAKEFFCILTLIELAARAWTWSLISGHAKAVQESFADLH